MKLRTLKLGATLVLALYSTHAIAAGGDGGQSGGGGNTQAPQPTTDIAIKYEIQTAQKSLPLIFNKISQFIDLDSDEYRAINKKLYGGRGQQVTPIQEAINKLQIHVLETGACISPLGEEDGAAYPDGSICLSLERIRKKVNNDNVAGKVAALVARETSHLVGLDEKQADIIQSVEISLNSTYEYYQPAAYFPATYVDKAFQAAIDVVKKNRSTSEICLALGALDPMTTQMKDSFVQDRGLSILARDKINYFTDGETAKIFMIEEQFCQSQKNKVAEKVKAIFKNRNVMSVEEFLIAYTPKDEEWTLERHFPINDLYLRKFEATDRKSLLSELNDAQYFNQRLLDILSMQYNKTVN